MSLSTLPLMALAVSPLIGSFVGLVADRMPRGETVLLGRSACRGCGSSLALQDLVPVLSWLILGGQCRQCGSAIGTRLLAIEFAAIAIALSALLALPEALVLPSCFLGWALLALALIDLDHLILPDGITLAIGIAGLLVESWWHGRLPVEGVIGILVGGGALAAVALLYRKFRGRDGLGWGDVKLFAAAGAWVGWAGLPSVLLIACLLGLGLAALAMTQGRATVLSRLPFGPPLAASLWFVWLCGPLSFGSA